MAMGMKRCLRRFNIASQCYRFCGAAVQPPRPSDRSHFVAKTFATTRVHSFVDCLNTSSRSLRRERNRKDSQLAYLPACLDMSLRPAAAPRAA